MYKHFTAAFFRGNRQRLRELLDDPSIPIVVTASGVLQRSNDTSFLFQQDANFWYLTGIDYADVVLVMDRDREYLIIPSVGEVRQTFDGGIDCKQLAKTSGIDIILEGEEGWHVLSRRLKKVKHVATMPAPKAYIEEMGMYTNPARRRLTRRMQTINSEIGLVSIRSHMQKLRVIKQVPELAAMQEAIDITVKTLQKVTKKRYQYEYEYEGDIRGMFCKLGASRHAYDPLVAGGLHACTIHYEASATPLAPNSLLLIDAGAQVEHYCADITRTIALGLPTTRQQAVYEAVHAVHTYVLSYLKPGMTLRESEAQAEQFMGEQLQHLGLLKRANRQTIRKFFPHATSHFLGLDAHDTGDYDEPLQPGMVITVEPGIYIPKESIGIRIEDNILITPTGCKNLSRRLSQRLAL